jgi:hypothetical protein
MKTQIASWASWLLVKIQIFNASLDPEVLQWPGGLGIALILWVYVLAPRAAGKSPIAVALRLLRADRQD